MLKYDKIDVSQGIDINKTSASKKFIPYHYWHIKDVGYKFQSYICNGCHVISTMAYKLKNIAVSNAKDVDYSCILWAINKNVATDR